MYKSQYLFITVLEEKFFPTGHRYLYLQVSIFLFPQKALWEKPGFYQKVVEHTESELGELDYC